MPRGVFDQAKPTGLEAAHPRAQAFARIVAVIEGVAVDEIYGADPLWLNFVKIPFNRVRKLGSGIGYFRSDYVAIEILTKPLLLFALPRSMADTEVDVWNVSSNVIRKKFDVCLYCPNRIQFVLVPFYLDSAIRVVVEFPSTIEIGVELPATVNDDGATGDVLLLLRMSVAAPHPFSHQFFQPTHLSRIHNGPLQKNTAIVDVARKQTLSCSLLAGIIVMKFDTVGYEQFCPSPDG